MEIQQRQAMPRVRTPKNAYLQLGALLGVALVAFIVTWFLMHGGSGKSSARLPAKGRPAIVTEAQLQALAKQTKFPVYWAGPKSGAAYELTRTSDGRIYIRYLQSASEVGTRSARFLTIGTYPSNHAFLRIQRAAKRKGGLSLKIGGGGMLVFNTTTPTSVYFGYPATNYQVEVYDPSPQQARTLVLGGKITPIR